MTEDFKYPKRRQERREDTAEAMTMRRQAAIRPRLMINPMSSRVR